HRVRLRVGAGGSVVGDGTGSGHGGPRVERGGDPPRAARDSVRVAPLLLPIIAFAALAGAVLSIGVLPGDAWLGDLVQAHTGPALVAVMHWINYAGNWRVLVPAAPLLLLFPRARRHWWVWLTVIVAAPVFESLLKPVIGRPRPESAAFGFPSGHATAAAAYFGALI